MAESVTQNRKCAELEVNSYSPIPLIETDVLLASHRHISANVFEHGRPGLMPYLFVSDVNEKIFGINEWTDYTGLYSLAERAPGWSGRT